MLFVLAADRAMFEELTDELESVCRAAERPVLAEIDANQVGRSS